MSPSIRAFLILLLFGVSLAPFVRPVAAADPASDAEALRGYLVGEYDLIGRKPDSSATYTGHISIIEAGEALQITRTIEEKSEKCVARFDTVAGSDRIPVLRMRFQLDGKTYEATYRWQSDPDNYPRLTGYVYLPDTRSPGLEALFPIHPK
jgi:hypothetical protein